MKKQWIAIALVLLAACIVLAAPAVVQSKTHAINEKVLRLHVIANSDSQDDQALKLAVRDRIISEVSGEFGKSDSIEETKKIAAQKLADIEKAAADEIKRQGKDYPVKAELGMFTFPIKIYGDMVFPPGEYEALRVVIGDGSGANWWCVMFPPLCFVDVTHTTAAQAETELKKVLTDKEIAELKKANNEEEVPLLIRFKVVDWIKGITSQLAAGRQ